MHTRILFFGALGARLGRERTVDIPDAGCTLAEVRRLLAEADADAGEALAGPGIQAAVDQAVVDDRASVRPGQEIAFLSPLSGG